MPPRRLFSGNALTRTARGRHAHVQQQPLRAHGDDRRRSNAPEQRSARAVQPNRRAPRGCAPGSRRCRWQTAAPGGWAPGRRRSLLPTLPQHTRTLQLQQSPNPLQAEHPPACCGCTPSQPFVSPLDKGLFGLAPVGRVLRRGLLCNLPCVECEASAQRVGRRARGATCAAAAALGRRGQAVGGQRAVEDPRDKSAVGALGRAAEDAQRRLHIPQALQQVRLQPPTHKTLIWQTGCVLLAAIRICPHPRRRKPWRELEQVKQASPRCCCRVGPAAHVRGCSLAFIAVDHRSEHNIFGLSLGLWGGESPLLHSLTPLQGIREPRPGEDSEAACLRVVHAKALGVGQHLLHAVGVVRLQEGQHGGRLKLAEQPRVQLPGAGLDQQRLLRRCGRCLRRRACRGIKSRCKLLRRCLLGSRTARCMSCSALGYERPLMGVCRCPARIVTDSDLCFRV